MQDRSKQNPRFSIIIPVYNAEKHISKCLNSIFSQTFINYEIVLVNDGSRDKSKEIIEEVIANNPDKKIVLYTQQNSGAGAARNKGIELSSGDYIVFLDSDDYFDINYLEKVNEKIESYDADVVFIDIVREDEAGHVIRYERMSDFSGLTKDRIIRSQLTGKLPWGGWRKITRASIIKENNLQYANIKVGEESIFSFNIIRESESIQFQPEAIYHYVDSQGSLTSNDTPENSRIVFDYIRSYLNENNLDNEYAGTIAAMAITSTVVSINVLAQQFSLVEACKKAYPIIQYYDNYVGKNIDYESLEKRVKLVYPFVRIHCASPIIIAGKIMKLMNENRRNK